MDSVHFRGDILSNNSLNTIFLPFRQFYDCSKRKYHYNPNGYSKHRFVEPPPKEFLCSLCIMVAKKPLECSKCGVLYCDTCSKTIKKHNEKKLFECLGCNSTKEPRIPSLILKKLIGEVKVYCCNLDKGCLEVVELQGLLKHESRCPYKQVVCENHQYCKKSGVLKEFLETELMFPGISAALAEQSNIKQKSYVCSDRCRHVLAFQRMVLNKQPQKALVEYFELLNDSQKYKDKTE